MYYLGIDIGGMSVKCGLVNQDGVILVRECIPTTIKDTEKFINELTALCFKTAAVGGVRWEDVASVGAAIPGTIHEGYIPYSNNLKWEDFDFGNTLSARLNKPVFCGNDANLACLAEQIFGAGKGIPDVTLVTLGTGVGTGIVVDSKMLLGNRSAGAEGGHTVIRKGGRKCNCGRRGCWETYASASALLKDVKAAVRKNPGSILAAEAKSGISGKTVFSAVRKGCPVAGKVLNNYIGYISEGLINLVAILRPKCLLIGGGVSAQTELLIAPLEDIVNKYAYGGTRNPHVDVKCACFGNDAGIVGAACVAMQGIQ